MLKGLRISLEAEALDAWHEDIRLGRPPRFSTEVVRRIRAESRSALAAARQDHVPASGGRWLPVPLMSRRPSRAPIPMTLDSSDEEYIDNFPQGVGMSTRSARAPIPMALDSSDAGEHFGYSWGIDSCLICTSGRLKPSLKG
jgi:hypothetical protein